jgi:dipeptidyl aminopeptidase/acylaminoacyl peptidase
MMISLLVAVGAVAVAQQPGLVDREIFFGDPEIAGGQLSPDGKYISFLKPYKGTRNIWVKGIDEKFEDAKPITCDTKRPIGSYFWSRDGRFVLYAQDKGGDENYHVYVVDPNGAAEAETGVPVARNITDLDGVRAMINAVPRSRPDVIYVGLNDRDPAYHDLYEVNIATGDKTLIYENVDKISGFNFDHDDVLRMASRSADDGSTEILNITPEGFKTIYTCSVSETAYISGFHKDNKKAYLVTNKGDINLSQLMLIDPETGETELVEKDPENEVDFGGLIMSSQTHEVLATVYVGAKQRIYFKDKDLEADYNLLKDRFEGSEINMGSRTEDEMLYLISVSSDTDPGTSYLFDRKTKKTTFQYRPRPKINPEDMSPMTPVTYKSLDGLEIPAYLTTPKGLEAKNLPAVLLVHGGPWARDYWGFNGYAQFLANRGYAVLSMNFRGSTGYGKSFLNAGDGEWGRKMQDDVTAGARYLTEQGIADKDKIAIMGGSYGGYAALAGVTFTPDEYAAGISIVGPSNLITLLESIPAYWESFRKVMYSRMADLETEEGKAWFYERSPLNHADKIKVPLLVVQGANDPRVKQAESDQIVVAMRELNLPVEYLVAPDEGHGFQRPVNQMAFIATTEKFLAKHIGGRYQKDMPEEVAKRLEEITVDINTVELPKELTNDDLTAELPKSNGQVKAGSYDIAFNIEMGGQKIPMPMTRVITEGEDTWTIQEDISSAMGDMSFTHVVHKGSLLPKQLEFTQGPASGIFNYSKTEVTGKVSMGGNDMPVQTKLNAPVCGEGGAMGVYLSSLDLSPGFTASLRTFDGQASKVKYLNLVVAGKEEVTVPAGTFSAFRVELKPADGGAGSQTYWIDIESRMPVKESAVVPEMGGALMTSELSAVK